METINPHENIFDAQQEPRADERSITLGIEAVRAADREVDDATARAIAAQLHGGQDSALYSLASTGNLADENDNLAAGDCRWPYGGRRVHGPVL